MAIVSVTCGHGGTARQLGPVKESWEDEQPGGRRFCVAGSSGPLSLWWQQQPPAAMTVRDSELLPYNSELLVPRAPP